MNPAGNGLSIRDWQEAIEVQDACNLSGVVHSFSRAMTRIFEEANKNGSGTDWVNKHPIAVLYADKVSHLTGTQYEPHAVSNAYDAVNHYIEAHTGCSSPEAA